MKSGKNFVIQYSTGAYELAKTFITNIIQSPEFQQTYANKTQDGKESSSAQVDMCIKIFNRKANGQVGGQLKFTVNLYHTSNTMNINGSRNDVFVNEIFDNLCDTIREQYGTLDIINETISSQLHNLRESSSTVIQNSLRTELVDKRSTNALCQTSTESNNTNIKSNTEYKTWTCPICELPVEEDCIACDSCDNWLHFRCAGIQSNDVRNVYKNSGYICNQCNDELMYSCNTSTNTTLASKENHLKDVQAEQSQPLLHTTPCKVSTSYTFDRSDVQITPH